MADYKKMYYLLFNKITDVINELQEVQRKTEELYISPEEPVIKILDISQNDDLKE